MQIKFYSYDFDYKIKDGQILVYLYSKLDTGKKVCVICPHEPYFYADVENIDKKELETRLKSLEVETKLELAKVTKWEKVEKELLGKNKKFWKIYVNYPKAVSIISKELDAWGVETYEKDILFVHRFLLDKNIVPMTLLKAEGEQVDDKTMRVPVFLAKDIEQDSHERLHKLKYLAIDIETYSKNKIINPNKDPVLMIAFYGKDENGKEFQKVITWKKFPHHLDYMEHVSDEEELLQRFRQIIFDYQPDIITGYFSDGFDFPYLKIRADKHKVKLDLGLDRSELAASRKAELKTGKTRIKGMLHLDIFKFIRNIFGGNLNTDSYSLNAVSEELLGHRKHDVELDDLAHLWDEKSAKLEDFCKYNLHDAHLALQLCMKLMPDMLEFTKIVGLPPYDITRMRFSRLVESYILRRALEFNVIAPNRPKQYEVEKRSEETYQGAFVYEPTPGLYDNILVFDFRSLYPTVIMAHNIGPESLYCKCCKEDKEAHVPERDEYWFCKKDQKFIPNVLERLILRRIDLKRLIKEMKDKGEKTKILEARSYALKILANSFYGYLGFFGARWYCIECARSTTAYARYYIHKTIKKAEEMGFKVVYGDTDSLFILLGDKHLDKAMAFKNEVNFDLPGHMELEFEGRFTKGIFVAVKGTDKGAKKKYALLREDGKIKVTGFETVRRNWSKLAKDVQEKVLKLVLEDKNDKALEYLRDITNKLKKGQININDLLIRTQITKDLAHYSSIGPHVAVALRMRDKGWEITQGTVIEYVVGKGSGLIRDRARLKEEIKNNEYDADYYLKHQVIPAVSSILAVIGVEEDEIFRKGGQTSLGKFG
jgi:DNA polymerase, archaea type